MVTRLTVGVLSLTPLRLRARSESGTRAGLAYTIESVCDGVV